MSYSYYSDRKLMGKLVRNMMEQLEKWLEFICLNCFA